MSRWDIVFEAAHLVSEVVLLFAGFCVVLDIATSLRAIATTLKEMNGRNR